MTAQAVREDWTLIGRGWVGWHADGGRSAWSTSRGVSSSGGTLDGYLVEAREGCLLYDASEADEAAFRRLVIVGPMYGPDLAPWGWSSLSVNGELSAMFQPVTVEALATLGIRSFSLVGTALYEALLRQVPGIKIGRVEAGEAVWE